MKGNPKVISTRALIATCLCMGTIVTQAQINAVWTSGNSGSVTDPANWVGGVVGAQTSGAFSAGDTAVINNTGAGAAVMPNSTTWAAALTIQSGAVFEGGNTTGGFRPLSLNNQGVYRYSQGSGTFVSQFTNMTNTGTIENTGAGTLRLPGGTITNTGGLIRATAGAIVATLPTVVGGDLDISNGATLTANSIATGSFTLNGVAVDNYGTANVRIDSTAAGNRTTEHDLTGATVYNNFGTLNVVWDNATAAAGDRTVRMGVASTATLNNQGTINISLTNTLNSGYTNQTYLEGASAFTNQGTINVNTTASSTGTAQLRWTNAISNQGNIMVEGPQSSIEMAAQTLTQTGFGSVLDVKTGGAITANTVDIQGGTLSGNGTINAAVQIGNATLSPGNTPGTLTVNGELTLGGSSILDFEMDAPAGTNDLVAITGDLTLDGTLNITDLGSFGEGTYTLFTYTGGLTDNGLDIGMVPVGSPKAFTYLLDTGTFGSVDLIVGVIPEPTSAALLGLAGLLVRHRRR